MPDAQRPEDLDRALADEPALRLGVETICERHGVEALAIERFADGSVPVFAIGSELVVKLCPPFAISERDDESLALRVLDGRLPIPTPRVCATGELDGWGYILMSRLEGESLARAWPRIGPEDRLRLAQSLGESLAALHALRDPRLAGLPGDWRPFIEGQRATCLERQRARGLDPLWCDQIPGFLEGVSLEAAGHDALLHTEVMREHLLVREGPGGWAITGLFDFEPAMVGAVEYEFVSAGLFVSDGDPLLLRRVLLAYGLGEAELGPALSRQLMAWGLLHRYSNLPWFLKRLPPPAGTRTLDELANCWFGLST